MNLNRRDLVKSSIAITFLTVSKASAQIQKTIGVVTTIKLNRNDDEWQCFVAGLNQDGWYETGGGSKHVIFHDPTGAEGKYGGSFNTSFLKGLIAGHDGVDLIGVVGGVISRVAAAQQLTNIPYVYLSGMAPSDSSTSPPTPLPPAIAGQYSGIILNIPALYAAARMQVGGSSPGNVWLVQNYNSGMTPAETFAWQNGFRTDRDFKFFDPAGAHTSPNNDASQFGSEVAKLITKMSGTVSGVIVSPDAFFRWQKTPFTTAMTSGLNVPICYPFKDYPLRTTPVTDQLLKGSPALSIDPNGANPNDVQQTAYYQFGYLAGQFLDNPNTLQPAKTWNWNGTTGRWL
jgi:hypothetical protein